MDPVRPNSNNHLSKEAAYVRVMTEATCQSPGAREELSPIDEEVVMEEGVDGNRDGEHVEPGPIGQDAALGEEDGQEDQQPQPVIRKAKGLPRPMMPTKAEREEHELTHVKYAAWCRHCVRARAMSGQHRKTKKHSKDR